MEYRPSFPGPCKRAGNWPKRHSVSVKQMRDSPFLSYSCPHPSTNKTQTNDRANGRLILVPNRLNNLNDKVRTEEINGNRPPIILRISHPATHSAMRNLCDFSESIDHLSR